MNIEKAKLDLAKEESKIIAITGDDIDHSDSWTSFPYKREEVYSLLESRRHILNKIFKPTEENMQQFRAVNDRLYFLTQQSFRRIHSLKAKIPVIMDCPEFDDDYESVATLRYALNSDESVLKLEILWL